MKTSFLPLVFAFIFLISVTSCSKQEVIKDPATTAAEGGSAGNQIGANNEEKNDTDNSGEESGLVVDAADEGIVLKEIDTLDLTGRDPEKELLYFNAAIDNATVGYGSGSDNGADSKTTVTVATDGTTTSSWVNGDQIKIYAASGSSATYVYSSASHRFTASDAALPAGQTYYAFYPASMVTSCTTAGVASFDFANITSSQGYYVSSDRSVTIANCGAPMSCCFTGKEIAKFYNLGDLLMVSVYGVEKIAKLNISCNDTKLTGTGTITMGAVGAKPTMSMTSGDSYREQTVQAGDAQLNTSTPINFYFILPPGQNMSGSVVTSFKATFTQSDGTNTYTPTMTRTGKLNLTTVGNGLVRVRLNAHYFSGGTGTQANPYIINTAEDLQSLYKLCQTSADTSGYNSTTDRNYFRCQNVYYQQNADIDLTGKAVNYCSPIGSETCPISFNYNGNNKKINYLKCNGNTAIHMALFGYLVGDGTHGKIENLTLGTPTVYYSASSVNANADCAGLVGYLENGIVNNCCVENGTIGVINSTTYSPKSAGLVAYMCNGSQVTNCNVRNTTVKAQGHTSASGTSSIYFCGGIVGECNNGTIINCTFDSDAPTELLKIGTVTGTTTNVGAVGGICAKMTGGSSSVKYPYLTNVSISSAGDNVGGVVGILDSGCTLEAHRSAATVSSSTLSYISNITGRNNVGGAIGDCVGTANGAPFSGSPTWALNYKVDVTGTGEKIGGIIGNLSGTLNRGYIFGEKSSVADYVKVKGHQYTGGVVGYSTGTISDTKVNYAMITGTNGAGTPTYYDNIGGVAGYVSGSFGVTSEGLTDAPVLGVSVEGNNNVGGFFGKMDNGSTLTNKDAQSCASTMAVTAHAKYAGGVAGYAVQGSQIFNATVQGTYTASPESSTVTVTANGGYAGGVAGFCDGTVSTIRVNQCIITASNSDYAGGIAGELSTNGSYTAPPSLYGAVSGCVISSNNYAGGIAGLQKGNITGQSTLDCSSAQNDQFRTVSVGYTFSGYDVATTTSPMKITASGNYAGGISGKNDGGTISTCKVGCYQNSIGGNVEIKAAKYVGGVCGYMTNNANSTIEKTMAQYVTITTLTGESATESKFVGGFVGRMDGGTLTARDNTNTVKYASITTTGQDVGGLVGLVNNGTIYGNNSYLTVFGNASHNLNGYKFCGGLIGKMAGGNVGSSSFPCNVEMSVTSSDNYAGGIAGSVQGGTLSYCTYGKAGSTGNVVTGVLNVGGVAGYLTGSATTIDHCSVIESSALSTRASGSGCQLGGIVGYIEDNGTVSNCTVSKSTIKSNNNANCVGGMVGRTNNNNCLISTCTVSDSDISGGDYVGGAVGHTQNISGEVTSNGLTASACTVSGGTRITGSGSHVGGICGGMTDGSISDAYVYCQKIQGVNEVGGIVGTMAKGTITRSKASGDSNYTVKATGYNVGGIVGLMNGGSLISCQVVAGIGILTAATSSTNISAGGIVGRSNPTNAKIIIDGCFANAAVKAWSGVGGIVGRTDGNSSTKTYITNCIFGKLGSTNFESGGTLVATANSGSRATGGIVGVVTNGTLNVSIFNCWASPVIKVTEAASGCGGVVGYSSSSETNGLRVIACATPFLLKEIYVGGTSQTETTGAALISAGNPVLNVGNYVFSLWRETTNNGPTYTNFTNHTGAGGLASNTIVNMCEGGGNITYYTNAGCTTSVTNKTFSTFISAGKDAAQTILTNESAGITLKAWNSKNTDGKYPYLTPTAANKFIVPQDVAPSRTTSIDEF